MVSLEIFFAGEDGFFDEDGLDDDSLAFLSDFLVGFFRVGTSPPAALNSANSRL